MSDIYLELRSRIPIVAEQTQLGTQRIRDAQARVGLSNEAIARIVHVSEKTWRRWKNQGSIPTASLPAAARALRLELHELDEMPTTPVDPVRLEEALDRFERGLDRMDEVAAAVQMVASAIEALLVQIAPQAPPGETAERRG